MSKFGERAAKMKKDRAQAQALAEGKKTEEPEAAAQTEEAQESARTESETLSERTSTEPEKLPDAKADSESKSENKKAEPKKKKKKGPRKAAAKKTPRKKAADDDGNLIMVGIRMSRQEKSRLKAAAALADTSVQEMVRTWIKNLQV